jgi:CO/xanthine dehydrogenase FAD-binding subunit
VTRSLVVASSLDDALAALAEGSRVVAGGTDLVVGARQGKAPLPERLVAVHRVTELAAFEEVDGVLRVGATVTHARLAADPLVQARLTALADASAIVGSHATRAQGTIGGNLMNASPAAETVGPLVCFGASVRLRSASGTRSVPVEELSVGPGKTIAEPGELLESVDVPLPADGTGSAYFRLEYRRQMEIAVVGVTAVVRSDGDRVAEARIAITALAPTVRRVPEAEALLVGTAGDDEVVASVGEAVAAASAPISDVRASARYRAAMAAVIGRRAVNVATLRARGVDVPVPANASEV